MVMPTFTMRQLLEAGVHFGHSTRRWNPKMAPFIFGERNNVHIIDLQQTVPMMYQACEKLRDTASNDGRILFVGTKRQASRTISEAAQRCGQYYVNHRWLGGMLTNWKTISHSIRRLKELEERLSEDQEQGLTKKELLKLTRERDKLQRALGGIKEMGAPADIVVIIDTNKESIAVKEANKLNIPVVAVIDSNSDPEGINFPIPGNDDSLRAIELYCDIFSTAVLSGLEESAQRAGADVGESAEGPVESLPPEGEAAADGSSDTRAEGAGEPPAVGETTEPAEPAEPQAASEGDTAAKPETGPAEAASAPDSEETGKGSSGETGGADSEKQAAG